MRGSVDAAANISESSSQDRLTMVDGASREGSDGKGQRQVDDFDPSSAATRPVMFRIELLPRFRITAFLSFPRLQWQSLCLFQKDL